MHHVSCFMFRASSLGFTASGFGATGAASLSSLRFTVCGLRLGDESVGVYLVFTPPPIFLVFGFCFSGFGVFSFGFWVYLGVERIKLRMYGFVFSSLRFTAEACMRGPHHVFESLLQPLQNHCNLGILYEMYFNLEDFWQ